MLTDSTDVFLVTGLSTSPSSTEGTSNEALIMNHVYVTMTAIMSALSMIGCVITLSTYLHFRELRMTSRRLLVFLSMADFLTALGNFLGVMWVLFRSSALEGNMLYCKAHSAMTVFSSISSYLWSTAIAIFLYVALVRANPQLAETLAKLAHAVCWPVPGTLT